MSPDKGGSGTGECTEGRSTAGGKHRAQRAGAQSRTAHKGKIRMPHRACARGGVERLTGAPY